MAFQIVNGSIEVNGPVEIDGITGTVTVQPATGSTFEIDGPVSINGVPKVFSSWRGATFFDQQINLGSANPDQVFGPYDVSDYGALMLYVTCTQTGVQVQVGHGADMASSQLVQTWYVNQNSKLLVVIPCMNDHISVDFICNLLSSGAQAYVYGAPSNLDTNRLFYPVADNIAAGQNYSIAAGGDARLYLPWIQPGLAHLAINEVGGTGHLQYNVNGQTDDPTKNPVLIVPTQNIGTNEQAQLTLPPRPCNLHVINTDTTAAHSFSGSLIAGGL